jgi:hypothetical protein
MKTEIIRKTVGFDEYDWAGWTDWVPLLPLDVKSVPAKPGAYVLATDQPIHRAIGCDPMGILDIGETGKGAATLRRRIERLRWCSSERGITGHMAGWRFAFFRFERHFSLASLRIRWVATPTKKTAYQHEGKVMLAYLVRHCELPPLNYKFNWSAFEKLGWGIFDDQV